MHADQVFKPVRGASAYSTYVACGLCALLILLIDLKIPLGIAIGILYIVVILISLKSSNNHFTIVAALVCTVLVWIGYLGSPRGEVNVHVIYINRFLSVLAIWVTAILTLMHRDSIHQLHQERLKNLQTKKTVEIQEEKLKVLKATMHTVQDIIGNFLNNLLIVKIEIDCNKTLNNESLRKLDATIYDTSQRINQLTNLNEVREKRMAGNLMGIEYDASKSDMAVDRTHDKLTKK
ncbi:hypothetical protein [Nitrosomonas sp.]|uniref:hypothetical protein n=1 Tax=Nitrosomonas sp. TaxID=42353 RepID=UPI001DBBF162|nr:hypothetical protein [Nitrosomonas sp.]MBX3616015.1 hypothetical protein [Nitrosomonas sp.]